MENHLGKTIEENRKKKDWSRQYLADRLGVNVSMISFYERGVKFPSYKKQLILSELFGITIHELVGEAPEMTLRRDITNKLFNLNLNQNELKFVLKRIVDFYCNNGNYNDFKDFHINNSTIDKKIVENAINMLESSFFNFFREEIYQNKDRTKVIAMSEVSKYIQENFSNTLKDIIENLNENEILHETFITIYEEKDTVDSNTVNTDLSANVDIKGYVSYPKDYMEKYIDLFGLLITNQSYIDRYKYNDVVIFRKYNNYIYDTDILISINGTLKIVKISKLEDKPKRRILVYTQKDNFDIYTEKQLKESDFKILGLPIEIKINYFNKNNDI